MNDAWIEELIKLKIDVAGKLLEKLPPDTSKKIIGYGRQLVDGIEEQLGKPQQAAPKTANKMNSIHIE
jgi:hypothetical protein